MRSATINTPSSSTKPDVDPGPLAGLFILALISTGVIVVSAKTIKHRCLHLPFVSLSFCIIFTYAALDVCGVEAPWLIGVLGVVVAVWILASAVYYLAHLGRSYKSLDPNDTSINGFDDGL